SPDEEVVLPTRKLVSAIEQDARRADRRHPVDARIVHPGPRPGLLRYERARVVAACRNERPAVVVAGNQDIDLVPAHRADLGLPELARLRVKGEAVAVAMAVRKDLGLGVAADER